MVALEMNQPKDGSARSDMKYRELYENMRDAVVSVSMEGKITESNPGFQAMLEYTSQESFERTHEDITPAKWNALEAAIIEGQVLKRGYSDPYEKEHIRRDGSICPVEVGTYLVRDDYGNPAGCGL